MSTSFASLPAKAKIATITADAAATSAGRHAVTSICDRKRHLQGGIHRRQQVSQLIHHAPGNVPRTSGGDNSFRCAGTIPQQPCTMNCMRKAPSASNIGVAANAHSGKSSSDRRRGRNDCSPPAEDLRQRAEGQAARPIGG